MSLDQYCLLVEHQKKVKDAKLESRPFGNVSCTLEDCSELIQKSSQLFPDKTKPVIIYCRSGRRAGKAKVVLALVSCVLVSGAGAG